MSVIPVTAIPRDLLASSFLVNKVPTTVLQSEPCISYSAYIPDEHYPRCPSDPQKLPLLIAVHGTGRDNFRHLKSWIQFANAYRCAVLTPIFPVGVQGLMDTDGYHYLGRAPPVSGDLAQSLLKACMPVKTASGSCASGEGVARDLRYDVVLLDMLDEVATRWPAIDTTRVFLTGFSGGGQFSHRFFYLHPERLLGVNVGAPGSVTALDFDKPWPFGVQNMEAVFGTSIDVEMLKKVPVMVSVGSEDKVSSARTTRRLLKGDKFESKDQADTTRVDRARQLVDGWKRAGLNVCDLKIVEGVKHEMEKVNYLVEEFMGGLMEKWWKEHEKEEA